jgi:hypothetical protein
MPDNRHVRVVRASQKSVLHARTHRGLRGERRGRTAQGAPSAPTIPSYQFRHPLRGFSSNALLLGVRSIPLCATSDENF